MSWNNQNKQPSIYHNVVADGQTLKVKYCDKNNCGSEIFWDPNNHTFIDLLERNSQKNFHWNYCLANNQRMQRTVQSSPQQQQQQLQQPPFAPPASQQQLYSQHKQLQQQLQQDHTDVNRETIQNILSEIQYLKSDLSQLRQMLLSNNDQLMQIVNNWIANNPIQNGLFQFIELFKDYLPPPQPITADKLVRDNSMNSDDINPIPEEEYDASK